MNQASGDSVLRKHVEYDSFGQSSEHFFGKSWAAIASNHAEAIVQLFGYTGQERDTDAGLYNYNARWYDPGSGRFISEDPSGFDGGDANLYRYVKNSPYNGTDPAGLRQAGNPLDHLGLGDWSLTSPHRQSSRPTSIRVSSSKPGQRAMVHYDSALVPIRQFQLSK
jgi:RHS repeat-associated protein